MQYLGGKSRIAKYLVAAIRPALAGGRDWWDPFCGGLSVSLALAEAAGRGLSTDGNPALVALYRAVADGWDPPSTVTEDDYRAARQLPDSDPRKAFCGFACSFSGKWFAGYARVSNQADRTYAGVGRIALLRDVGVLVAAGVQIARVDFLSVEPEPTTTVIYCDPPYLGTTAYGATGAFDHVTFCHRVAGWARHTDVFVSEYSMPPNLGGRLAMEFSHDMSVAGGVRKGARIERLYHYSPDLPCGHPTLAQRRRDCPVCA